MESQAKQNALLSSLLKIEHGDLGKFIAPALPVAESEPGLYAHVIAWNEKNGRVRDSKMAFPVIALRTNAMKDDELAENAVAHLMLQGPRELVKAYRFSKTMTAAGQPIRGGRRRMLEAAIKQYLEVRERDIDWWTSAVIRSRKAMKELYIVSHKQQPTFVDQILFRGEYPGGSAFEAVANLKRMAPMEAAGAVLHHNIPFTVASCAGVNLDDPAMLIALVQNMSATELITAANQLSKLKAWKVGAVQDAFQEATGKAKTDKRANVLKAQKAAETVEGAREELAKVQEAAVESLRGINGDWLVLADKSPSMAHSIEAGKQLAALLARCVKGKVHLTFFDSSPVSFDVSGKTLDEVQKMTKHIVSGSATSIGCGLRALRERKETVDGIVIISDGEENTAPFFPDEYKKLEGEPALYYIQMRGGMDNLLGRMRTLGVPVNHFDARQGMDYTSMLNVVSLLKPQTYGFLEEVMGTPLKSLKDVFRNANSVLAAET